MFDFFIDTYREFIKGEDIEQLKNEEKLKKENKKKKRIIIPPDIKKLLYF